MMNKIRVLDGIRGLAALMVLWAHFPLVDAGVLVKYFQQSSRIFYSGYLGVDIFFALSGFLITRILLREKQGGGISFSRFYLKRSLRIFPLYYLVILLVGLIISWDKLGWSAAYLSNYYFSYDHSPNALRHTWSLCVEEHFYLFWPLLISLMSLRNSRTLIAYILPTLAVVSAILALVFSTEGVLLVNKATHIRILTLSLGSLLAFHEVSLLGMIAKHRNYLILIGLALLVGLGLTHAFNDLRMVTLNRYITSAGVSVIFLMVVLSLQNSNPNHPVVQALQNRVFTFFGKISYGVYLYHLPILFYFNASHMDDALTISVPKAMLLLSLCIVIPVLSYYAFEKPILVFKDRLVGLA